MPFGFLVQTLVIVWYALSGYHPDDLASRHAAEPWYDHKTELGCPAFPGLQISCPFTRRAQGSGVVDFRCCDLQRWVWVYGVSLLAGTGPVEDDEVFRA